MMNLGLSQSTPVMRRLLAAAAVFCSMLFAGAAHAQFTPASGYWWNSAQGGNGFVIEIQGSSMYMAGFLYATSGEATWVASLGPMTSATQYSGSLLTFSGGETLTGTYKAATQSATSAGNISITFTSATQATLTWPGGTEKIQRLDFGPGGNGGTQPATNPQTGWWWNTAEGGRGFGIEVQGNSMYLAGYMYDTSGNPVWYLASGAMTDNGLFQGEWTQYQGGLTLSGPYKAPSLLNGNVGSVTLQFSSTSSATLTLPNGRQIPITRLSFGVSGPTLTSFTPAAAAPAGVLNVTGANINPNATLSLNLSDNTGYSVNVPLTTVTSTGFTAAVPPYFNSTSGAFGSGTVSMALTQTSGGASVNSNSLTGFSIQSLPVSKAAAGQSTLSLIRANLAAAQKLQTSIKGTAQDSPTVEAEVATQITDLQTLATNVQSVVQNGVAFSLGAVGGVNITVNQSNISDVDSLILATLQSLATPPGGSEDKSSSGKTVEAASPGCMSAEASAFAQALLAGSGNFDALAQALVNAPGVSSACGTAGAFGSAYQIFGGAGNIGIGIADLAGLSADASKLPGATLFATTNANANIALGLNALLSPALATEASAVQSAIGNVTALSQPATSQLIAEATGFLQTAISDSQTFITTVAPPPSSGIPGNVPAGTYSVSIVTCTTLPNFNDCIPNNNVATLTNVDPVALAGYLSQIFSADCTAFGATLSGITCTQSYVPFNGTTFSFTATYSGVVTGVGAETVVATFTLTKIG
jgi:hypothetical protein